MSSDTGCGITAPTDGGARVHGSVAPGWEAVAEEFERNLTDRDELGAAFCAVVDGRVVADLWGGRARARGNAWRHDTLCLIFSGTKGLVATCVLVLIERGLLDLDMPVSAYWPEFSAQGKDGILVRHVVSHQAGLPGLVTPVSIQESTDPVRMAELLAEQPALTAPGDVTTYHVLTYGWLCGELIRRVDGRSVGRFFREEIAEPLDLDIWIGLPDRHEERVAVLEHAADLASEAPAFDSTLPTTRDRILWSMLNNPPTDLQTVNSRQWHAAEVPGAGAIATARSLARLYGCMARGGEVDGVRLLSASTLELGRRYLARERDPYLNRPIAYGVGFELQADTRDLGPEADAYGHGGAGGSVHGAWPSLATGFSYTMNRMGASNTRASALLDALHRATTEAGQPRTAVDS